MDTEKVKQNPAVEAAGSSGGQAARIFKKENIPKTAWFTPDVPFGCAPYGYYGLPGLVVHMEIPMFNLDLESITEVDGVQLNPPTEGKPTTEEGLTKDANKALEELMNKADKVTKIE